MPVLLSLAKHVESVSFSFMTYAITETSSDAVKSTLSLSLLCSCIKKEPKAQPGMLWHLQVTGTP